MTLHESLTEAQRLRRDEPEQFRAMVAEKVRGERLCRHEENKHGMCLKCGLNHAYWALVIPMCDTDPDADLLSLEEARKWEASNNPRWDQFVLAMCSLCHLRTHTEFSTHGSADILLRSLKTGMFSEAALAVVLAKEGDSCK
jgi:hypothetical protein